ncbi:MAG: 2-amino-4-hydroxy-6-hydroxymethyldihydropteridine diphosphokinase [Prevotella sp.]|nr:2-amino-4-hydroxy-6-hydroxymethyldihydropteridine diphosphokinase [Prevotella sp.]
MPRHILSFFYYFCNVREERIIIALGCNVHRQRNMRAARALLSEFIPDLQFTRNIKTQPIGTVGGLPYLNCLGWGFTSHPRSSLSSMLKEVEQECGNTSEKRLSGQVEMDVDLLLYGSQRHHEKDWSRPYIATLLEEIGN